MRHEPELHRGGLWSLHVGPDAQVSAALVVDTRLVTATSDGKVFFGSLPFLARPLGMKKGTEKSLAQSVSREKWMFTLRRGSVAW